MNTEKAAIRSLGDKITFVVMIAIMIMGAGVLAGWHLNIVTLVQIIPDTIAMQYNTALCFIVLGASTCALVAGRGHQLIPVVGGGLVTVMGILNIFEYLTGISLGIDTALFYPWEQTLLVQPGRMALTTAISFAISGGALVLLALRPSALAAFAIANTLPLSIGLTSMIGYLLAVTYMLTFRLGIQMAAHTALAFLAYGWVMLRYAWRHTPQTDQGLPRWSPALAIIVAPFFFVGFSVTIQSSSAMARGAQLFISLLSAALFGLAIHKLTKWKIARKGLILISIPLIAPLVFTLAVIGLVKDIRRNNEQLQTRLLQSKEVTVQTQALLRTLVDADSGIRGYVITSDPAFAETYYRASQEVPEAVSRLQSFVRGDLEREASVHSFGTKATKEMEFMADLERLMRAGARDQAAQRIKSGIGKSIMDEFRQEITAFLDQDSERLGKAQQIVVSESRQRFYWLLVAGVSIDILLTLILAFLFSRGISRRILRLTQNAQALAEGKELAPTMTGTDEIACLDRDFHDVAQVLEETAKKERAIIENALDVICSVDAEGKFVEVNPACFKLWGYTAEELIGRRYIEFVAPEDIDKTNQAAEDIMGGHSVTDFENRYQRKDGSTVSVMWSAFWSETEKLMFCVARDITERKQTEEKIRQLNKELEAFSYSVSHDLRAPLRHIDGFADLLQKHACSALDEKSQRYLKTISQSAKQMGNLVDSLLAFSRMGRTEMRSSRVSLEQLVNDVRRDLCTEIEGRKIIWEIESLPEVQGDPSMLRQVLMNLISNAVKYTGKRAVAHIEIGSTNGNKNETVVFVRDNGAGFDMRYIDKLFGVFQRLHRADEFEGTGIGLANVQRIIHRHGGETWAEGSVEGGAAFYFSLPKMQKG